MNIRSFISTVSLVAIFSFAAMASQRDITGPSGSGYYGERVAALANGNFVVTDSSWDNGATVDVGAVYLYSPNGTLISRLNGSRTNDNVGISGILALPNGNYVVFSPYWDNGAVANAGAATWCSGVTGCSGAVTTANSLTGSAADDSVGESRATVLANGNYVVRSTGWNNGAATNTGAVTWCNGTTGRTGTISASNSLVGSRTNDRVGYGGVVALTNGNFVISSTAWHNGVSGTGAGAVTWGNGSSGTSGVISSVNSLVGSSVDDAVGETVTALTNGNYVVASPEWDSSTAADVGAVTWGNGTAGVSGLVSSTNSLVGSAANDFVGYNYPAAVVSLTNGNYVVVSPYWDNGAEQDVGAVTWCNGSTGRTGQVSTANSLYGPTSQDSVGENGVTALSNGNYVVSSSGWDNPTAGVFNAGAVTWCNGATGRTGPVTIFNSTYGPTAFDFVGFGGITPLTNGNYVIASPNWDNGSVANVGAATFRDGASGQTGAVSASNSLIGTNVDDAVSSSGISALTNGNYVVGSNGWHGSGSNRGAATWCNGTTGRTGAVTFLNSLVGDRVGSRVKALTNGNYVVASPYWKNGAATNAGAATWGNGASGTIGTVSPANSLVGTTTDDYLGSDFNGFDYVTAVTNGNYVIRSPRWDNGPAEEAGAVSYGRGDGGTVGPIGANNSVRGTAPYLAGVNNPINFSFNAVNNSLVVGRPVENIVSTFSYSSTSKLFDYDGDGKTDASVYRPSTNAWYLLRSQAGFAAYQFGANGDSLVPADYTGDGKTDVAIWRPSTGVWFILKSEDNTVTGGGFGQNGDLVAPGDYDGDGKDDLAVYRPGASSTFFVQRSTAGFQAFSFGIAEDKPTLGDFDGDGKTDFAVYRPSQGAWYRFNSGNGAFYAAAFGQAGDKVVPADYTGDGKTDLAIWRESTGVWFVLRSEDGAVTGGGFGSPGDIPSPGDYDGDGKTDFAVYRQGASSTFYVLGTTSGFQAISWGINGDKPTPNAYVY